MYVCMYVYIYIYICICTHTYITNNSNNDNNNDIICMQPGFRSSIWRKKGPAAGRFELPKGMLRSRGY